MKKKSIFFVFLLVSGWIIGCKKPDTFSSSNNSGGNNQQMVPMGGGTPTPGDAHNEIVDKYYNTYGPDTIIDYNKVKAIVSRTAEMFIDEAGLDADDLNTIVNNEMAEFWDMGIFAPDSTLVPEDSFKAALALAMPTQSMRSAWLSIINDGTMDFIAHYNNAQTTLNAMVGLTAAEITINDGSLSILESSYELFSGMTTTQKARIIADADAMGFAVGLDIASHSWWGWEAHVALVYAHHMSAKVSLMEALYLSDK